MPCTTSIARRRWSRRKSPEHRRDAKKSESRPAASFPCRMTKGQTGRRAAGDGARECRQPICFRHISIWCGRLSRVPYLGDFDGTVLLKSKRGVAAGYAVKSRAGAVRESSAGIPGVANGWTAAAFVPAFLWRPHAGPCLIWPRFPDGVGGLVFNWHIDARNSLRPLKILADEGVFDRGRFSIHFTAGPDVDDFGDHKGLDVRTIPKRKSGSIICWRGNRRSAATAAGSITISDITSAITNPRSSKNIFEINKEAMEKVTGKRVTEYSAPLGNHPAWVTRWLEKQWHRGLLLHR